MSAPPGGNHRRSRRWLAGENFDGAIWEPACGRGAISMMLEAAGHQVVSTDLIQRDYGNGSVDFLSEPECRAKHIITNPPFGRGLGDAFVRHALHLTRQAGGTVAMLLNLGRSAIPSDTSFGSKTRPLPSMRSMSSCAGRKAMPISLVAPATCIATAGRSGSPLTSAARRSGGSPCAGPSQSPTGWTRSCGRRRVQYCAGRNECQRTRRLDRCPTRRPARQADEHLRDTPPAFARRLLTAFRDLMVGS